MSFNQIKKDLLFSDVDWNMPMETRFKKTKAPFIPQEAVFNERPLRDSKADGKNNTLFQQFKKQKDNNNWGEAMKFDENLYEKFLKEDSSIK